MDCNQPLISLIFFEEKCLWEKVSAWLCSDAAIKVNFFKNFPQTMLLFQDEDIMVLDPKKDRSKNFKCGKLHKNVFQYLEMLE